MNVLLWDIDGTLLTTARAGVFALSQAAVEVAGADPDIAALPTAGLTDAQVAACVLEAAGAPVDPETVQRFLRAYERALPERLAWREGRVLPGVREILEAMSARTDVLSLLLTGNTEAGAAAKLRHYGLDGYFALGGGFCVDGGGRAEIARRALGVAADQLAGDVDLRRTFVIGDTGHDIAAGREIGARTVAVAFTFTPDELREHDPWLVLDVLPAPEQFVASLGLDDPARA